MKLIKYECEICGEKDKSTLDFHHITPKTDPNCSENSFNRACLCSSCHRKTHSGSIKIIGLFPSTHGINGRTLIYEKNGVKNLDVDEPYYTSRNRNMRLYEKER